MLTQSSHTERNQAEYDVLTEIQPDGSNPFPGLRPFTVDECHLYFGREGQVDDILLKLSRNRFVCVMGYSGSGKSSLMSCGLVPVLYGGFVTHSSPHWHVIIARPGASPLQNLTDAVVDYLIAHNRVAEDDRAVHTAIINSVLRSGSHGLIEVSKYLQQHKLDNVFFMVDQFEELFRFHETESSDEVFDETQLYVNLILNAIHQQDTPVYIAVTMRSDFIAKCSAFSGLTEIINESNYLVPQMTRDQKRMAIEGPIAVGGGRISQRLVKRLLADMGRNQDQLPILQHALMRTWDYWVANREPGEPMDIRHYNAIGKISQALSLHANEIFDELSPRQKEIAEILFKSVTEKSADNRGMRRPARLGLIAEISDADEDEIAEVVEHFRKPGRSFLMPAHTISLNADSQVELSHESLMRIWNRLNTWVEEEFESAAMYKRISEAAAMYQIGKTSLWRPPDLQLALNWQKKQRPTREWAQRYDEAFERAIVFLDTSRITYEAELKNQELQQKRMLQRARVTAIVLGIAAVIALLFLVFAYTQKIAADNSAIEAKLQEAKAIEQANAAELARQDAEAQRLKVEAANKELEEAKGAVEDALKIAKIERDRAEALLLLAQQRTQEAITAGEQERAARLFAEQETARAEANFEVANRLYFLAKAQEMAGKSVQEDDDKDLAGTLAMQAYHFHKRYDGKRYDPYIYNALYHALTVSSGLSYNAIKVPGPSRNRMNALAISDKGTTYYAAGADGRIFMGDYEKRTGKPTAYQNPFPNKVLALSKDERYLVNGTDSATVQVFDLQKETAKPLLVSNLKGATNAIEFLPDNSGFIVSKSDKTLSFVDHQTGKVRTLVTTPSELKAISISPDSKNLVGASWTGQLVLVNLETNAIETLVSYEASQILSVNYSPDGKMVAYGTFEKNEKRGLVKLYNIGQRKEERQFTGHKAGVYDVEFSPDGKLLASAGSDRLLQMWVLDFIEDLPVKMDNNNGFIWDIAFSNDSKYLIAAGHESEIRVWPTDPQLLANQICPQLKRNMTEEEWKKYVGDDIKYESTCVNLLIKDY
ncbi:MAG: High-affnity carbon uptake protein Hat/HatR [Cyclobacteriaceae bacterium]|nr:High-affnity carbon uptake protein Hat/HatR [Cyclobacteriaceae bacterium]UYN85279.1 MAG: High-affnity carbon uptake protein Hat/HatR [Cyclobacteriaceae bacterium]